MAAPTILDFSSRTAPVARKNWIKKAIRHPGRETERAKRNGVSVREQMTRDAKSSDPSLRAAGNLGLRLSKMHRRKAEKRDIYASSRDKMKD